MKARYLIAALTLMFASMPAMSGQYDGAWSLTYGGVNAGYATISEKNGQLLVVLLPGDRDGWEAHIGPITGNTAQITSAVSDDVSSATVNFSSLTTLSATITSCTPAPDSSCQFAQGTSLFGTKVF